MPAAPTHRHGEHYCYCPTCDYMISVEEGQKCNIIDCPKCGTPLRALTTGEYRGISGESPSMGAPILGLLALVGIAVWAVARKG